MTTLPPNALVDTVRPNAATHRVKTFEKVDKSLSDLEAKLRKFVDTRLYRIKGFLHPVDAMVFAGILSFQRRSSFAGGVAEVGVYFGRSFTLMAKSISPLERAFGLDLFDIRLDRHGNSGQLSYVKNMLEREDVLQNCLLQTGSSMGFPAENIVSKIGNVRFFSIDGGHEGVHVENDSRLALACLAPYGVLAFDDFFNTLYPDLSVVLMDFIRRKDVDLVPFCLSQNKLYLCKREYHGLYLEHVNTNPYWASMRKENFKFLDHDIVHCTQRLANRALYQKFAEMGAGRVGDYLTRSSKHLRFR